MAWDGQLGTVWYKLDIPPEAVDGGSSAQGTWTFQNSTPTDLRFQNSEPGFGDTAPYSARTYANQAGSIGKQSEIQAPADLARPYLCDLDNSRPGYLGPRTNWDNGINVAFDPTPGGGAVTSAASHLVETAMFGMGVLVQTTGGSDAGLWYYRFDVSARKYVPRVQVRTDGNAVQRPFCSGLQTQVRSAISQTILHETSGHVWCPRTDGGAVDISRQFSGGTGPQTPTQTGVIFWHFISFGGYLLTFEQTDPTGANAGITISMRNPQDLTVYTPAGLAGIDAAPELGNAPIQEKVLDEICCYPPVVYSGAVYVCTDRTVFKVVYDDENARILAVPIHTSFTRITGNPEIFQGSLFVPSGNTLWKWTPGQLEFTPIPIDSFGSLPPKYGGGIAGGLRAIANGLLIAVQSSPSNLSDSVLLKMDAQNVFSMLDVASDTGVVKSGTNQNLVYFVDSTASVAGVGIGVVCTGTGNSKRVVFVRESSRDPVFVTGAARYQVPGSHFWVSPVDPGVNYGDAKQALSLSMAVADLSSACIVRVYYQVDYDALLADSMTGGFGNNVAMAGTVMEGTGRWTLFQTFAPTAGTPQGLNLTPNGGYAGFTTQSMVSASLNLRYQQIRWCIEIIGDTSGVLYPRVLGMKFYYSETPAMYIVHSLRIRILIDDPDLADAPKSGAFPPAQTPDDVWGQFNQIYTYARNGTFVPFLDPNGGTRYAKVTKIIFNGVDLVASPDGIQIAGRHRYNKMLLQLAIQEADSAI